MICGTTVVISTVYERGMSYEPVEVENRTLGLVFVEKSDFIPRWGQSLSRTGFHTCLFYTTILDSQVAFMRSTCDYTYTRILVQTSHVQRQLYRGPITKAISHFSPPSNPFFSIDGVRAPKSKDS